MPLITPVALVTLDRSSSRRSTTGVARPLTEGLAVPTVVTDPSGTALFDIEPISFDQALRRAVAEDPELAPT